MNGNLVPKAVFFTSGIGRNREKLSSFELSLRNAGIHRYNLVNVSSIYPPKCKIISREEGLKMLSPGQIVFTVMASNSSNEPYRVISASVGCAIPKDENLYGYLSEHHGFGEDKKTAGDYAEDLAAYMLATTLGIVDEDDIEWDAKKDVWKLNDKIVRTTNETVVASVGEDRRWTNVVAAAVFIT